MVPSYYVYNLPLIEGLDDFVNVVCFLLAQKRYSWTYVNLLHQKHLLYHLTKGALESSVALHGPPANGSDRFADSVTLSDLLHSFFWGTLKPLECTSMRSFC